jgi:hypothetical protein
MGNTKSTTQYKPIAPHPVNVSLTIPSKNRLGVHLSMEYEDTIFISDITPFISELIFKNSHDFDIIITYSDNSVTIHHFSPLAYLNTLEYDIIKYVDDNIIVVNQKRFNNKDNYELSMMYDLFGKPIKLFISPLLLSS